ncbi:MAG TPA: class I SAM-dependent methyltransferase, partial [Gammaproteobacteria bacterium]|nr:class I SAM-dependent methyltransferase [Gammaproteobacteria bacterium]
GALVTCAALLDLVSQPWLDALVRRCVAAGAPVLFALIYDGRTTCEPAEPEDAEALELFNRHQLGDKGFGAALGPHAPRAVERALAYFDYRVDTRTSDWRLEPRDAELQRALVDGWLQAALKIAPHRAIVLLDWHRKRLEHIALGRSRIVVGHIDVAGQPAAT